MRLFSIGKITLLIASLIYCGLCATAQSSSPNVSKNSSYPYSDSYYKKMWQQAQRCNKSIAKLQSKSKELVTGTDEGGNC